ncbi:hypothetical protein [Variovorax sp. Sphag1AA]|uniref:hypothetical protein n=1 Tax=Variovorax sp. Sphag1AA TaxID=2587027 RepID=UPI001618181A|nr:hypothetical protein [Variovorax sp. Sphag1AA]MBB3181685.1 hypothetical protein [Variovorax sp. Sphag1AA]
MTDTPRESVWTHQIDDVLSQIMREASICQVKMMDPGVIEAVLKNNDSVCGHQNPLAFKKLREALMMGFMVREKAYDVLGPIEAQALIDTIRERLRQRMEHH